MAYSKFPLMETNMHRSQNRHDIANVVEWLRSCFHWFQLYTALRAKNIRILARYIAMPLKKTWFGSVQSHTLPILLPSGLGDDGKRHGGDDHVGVFKRVT